MSNKDIHFRRNILLNVDLENSRDLKKIREVKQCAEVIRDFATSYTYRKFDIADKPVNGYVTLTVEYNSEKAKKNAERLVELAEELEKESEKFYKAINVEVTGMGIGECSAAIH